MTVTTSWQGLNSLLFQSLLHTDGMHWKASATAAHRVCELLHRVPPSVGRDDVAPVLLASGWGSVGPYLYRIRGSRKAYVTSTARFASTKKNA
jgi:hypothetical protein